MRKSLLLLTAGLFAALSLHAEKATGEWSEYITGQPTNDHFFTRMTYNDVTYDNVISFKDSNTQTVWLWLDDDEIYQNEKVQALTPIAYNAAGDLYSEVAYNSFQADVMIPEGIDITYITDDEGDEFNYAQGDRLPSSSTVVVREKTNTVQVDGITYRVFLVIVYNTNAYGSHLSAKSASRYKANGALRKDDAPVLGLYVTYDGSSSASQLDDIIIGNIEFGLRETYVAEWDPNSSKFLYCTGGNNESPRFQFYNRVSVYTGDITDHGSYDLGDVNHDGIVDVKDVTALIAMILGNGEGCEICADVNGDGIADVKDVTALISMILGNN